MYSKYDFSPLDSWRNTNIWFVSSFFACISFSNSCIFFVASTICWFSEATFLSISLISPTVLLYSSLLICASLSLFLFCSFNSSRSSSKSPNVVAAFVFIGVIIKNIDRNIIHIFSFFIIFLGTSLQHVKNLLLQLLHLLELMLLLNESLLDLD